MGEWTKAEMTRKAHSPAHTQDIQMQAYYPYRQQQQQQQRRGLATQAKKKETSAAKNNAEVGIPVDPAVPYRKTSFNMVQPMLPSHQKMFDPEDVQSPYQQPGKWHPGVKRCGVVALKCGMTADYDSWGRRFPLTMLKVRSVVHVNVLRFLSFFFSVFSSYYILLLHSPPVFFCRRAAGERTGGASETCGIKPRSLDDTSRSRRGETQARQKTPERTFFQSKC